MGAQKTKNHDLPARMSRRAMPNGTFRYYYRKRDGGAISLGSSLDEALKQHALIERQGTAVELFYGWEMFARKLHAASRRNARNRGIDYALSEQEVTDMMRSTNGRCSLTGAPFALEKPDGARMRPWAPSIDRIDSRGPYTRENCRIVAACVNVALNEFGEDLLIAIANALMLKRGGVVPTGRLELPAYRLRIDCSTN